MQLIFQNVCKSFGDLQVLNNLSFTAESGKAFGLLGRNGAGKTTSIRILMNVFKPDSGEIFLDDESLSDRRGADTRFGYLPEEKGLYPKLGILHQMSYIGELRGLTRRDAKLQAKRWLKRLGMLEHQNRKLETLSKGNQQKIQLATALIQDPELVVLDEPFSGLDPVNSQLLKEVVEEQVAAGKLVLFSSHQMTYVETFCDHVAILHHGEIVLEGAIQEVKRSYPRDFIVLKLGTTRASMPQEEALQRMLSLDHNGCLSRNILTVLPYKDGSILVELARAEDKDDLLADLVRLELPIERFSVLEPSLEDIFVQMTTDSEDTADFDTELTTEDLDEEELAALENGEDVLRETPVKEVE